MVCLSGPLGAGKSLLARGLAEGLGAGSWQGSPTFNLIHEYDTRPRLIHLDLYRLAAFEADELGLGDFLVSDTLTVIEWPERAIALLKSYARATDLYVEMAVLGPTSRSIRVYPLLQATSS